jgi:hypothetical protein
MPDMVSVQPPAPDSNKTNPLGVECGEYTVNFLNRPWFRVCSVIGVHVCGAAGGGTPGALLKSGARVVARQINTVTANTATKIEIARRTRMFNLKSMVHQYAIVRRRPVTPPSRGGPQLPRGALAPLAALVAFHVPWYVGTKIILTHERGNMPRAPRYLEVERVQTGVRMERRILKVLKALAEFKNMTLGDLLEGIVLHAFDGKTAFTPDTLRKIADLKAVYDLDLDAKASHRLKEKS